LDGYPIYMIRADGLDVTGFVESIIHSYLGEARQVELTGSGVVIDAPVDGLDLRRVVNSAGVVGVRVRLVVRVQQGYGGSPLVGDTYTSIAFALPDGTAEAILHASQQQFSKVSGDELVVVMDSVFSSISV
jgi:hypothetical protein